MGLVLYTMSVMNNLSHQILGRRNCQIFFLRDDEMDLFFYKEKKRKRDKVGRVIFHKEKKRKRDKVGRVIFHKERKRTRDKV
jgi:hypothetical protein